MIKSRIVDIIKRVNDAAAKSIHQQKVKIIAVSKTKTVEDIMGVYQAGLRDFGQNYVNEIEQKHEHVPKDLNWHFVGHLQSNKIKKLLVPGLKMIQTVDRSSLADKLNAALKQLNRQLNILVQIKTSEQQSKSGIQIQNAQILIKHIIENCKQLNFKGLMTIGKQGDIDAFQKMLELKKSVANKFGFQLQDLELSMGMSADFEQAIQHGATSVRIGTLLFGPRQYKK